MAVRLKPLASEEVAAFWQLAFRDPQAEWTQWNGPYFHDHVPTYAEFVTGHGHEAYEDQPWRQVIWVDDQMVGMVSAYYDDAPLNRWLDVGIIIYDQHRWQRGIGRTALSQWIDWLWTQTPLPHIGLTTWSGNQRMCHLAESLGLREEARVRQVRYWQGRYWDSVKYGVLREEWHRR
ncbi:GNAT family N-acetyltransferase [Levilactobacillus brevis]|uniref:GNAT family N-acetyltransferase n=1 Tax=Levilactobacillus brevis TaxID=1580 RepID=UPI001123A9ED|nr:GNAT family protein [Levilactobacillus brevis]TOY85003.1 GNAT family N-acetyltransferase [Levilactobacillus brevis]